MPCVTGNKKALAAAGQLALVGLASLLPGCSGPLVPPSSPAEIGEIRQGYLIGYLPRTALPDSLQLLPPPPEIGSAAFAADEDIYKATRSYRDSARWQLASQDATLSFPRATEAFICPLGMPISQDLTPHLTILLRRSLADAGLSTYTAKDKYRRTRPFVLHKEQSCTPGEEVNWSKDGSYPSGHAALGWAWALILAEIAPERADDLLGRGYDFGQSRVICGVHWQSDVDAGRVIGAATVARLHADPLFKAQVVAAKAEVDSARTHNIDLLRVCRVNPDTSATISQRQ